MLSKYYRIFLSLLVILAIGSHTVWANFKEGQIDSSEKKLLVQQYSNQEKAYSELQVKKAEKLLSILPESIDKIKILLKVSDWYEASYNNPKTLEKAFQYAQKALEISQKLHSRIYCGKCYLQLSMIHELRNNNLMIEVTARKAIKMLINTDQLNDLAESWVMVWSSKMRTNAPIKERLNPIFEAASIFEKTSNNKRIGDCYREISELYFSSSNFSHSLHYLKKAVFYYKAANLKQEAIYPISTRLNIIYEADKRNRDIIRLKNKTLLQQSKLENEVFLRNSMVIFVALLLIILGLLYKSFMFKKRTNQVLETQQDEINKKKHHIAESSS